jgi:F-type H+-transporting ATPase subunit a
MEEPGTWLLAVEHLLPEGVRGYININVLWAWATAAVLLLLARRATRNLKVIPESGWQSAAEGVWTYITGICDEVIGPGGARFAPFLASLFVYILLMNLFGLIPGFMSPTSNITMTGALAVTAIGSTLYFGFRVHGMRYLMHFVGEPVYLAPLNILLHCITVFFARPLSLAVRLFANIFAEDMVVVQLVAMAVALMSTVKIPLPIQLPMLFFHILVSVIQAMIFTILTAAYIAEAVSDTHEEGAHKPSQEVA